jgi:hypothetical protein
MYPADMHVGAIIESGYVLELSAELISPPEKELLITDEEYSGSQD